MTSRSDYDLDDPADVRRMLLEVEAEGVRLMNEAEAEHLQRIWKHPVKTDDDYRHLAELTDEE